MLGFVLSLVVFLHVMYLYQSMLLTYFWKQSLSSIWTLKMPSKLIFYGYSQGGASCSEIWSCSCSTCRAVPSYLWWGFSCYLLQWSPCPWFASCKLSPDLHLATLLDTSKFSCYCRWNGQGPHSRVTYQLHVPDMRESQSERTGSLLVVETIRVVYTRRLRFLMGMHLFILWSV